MGPGASAQTFVEHNAEFRMQLDFVVPDAALEKFLPAGWEPNIATQGPAKDCNLRMIFIDRVDITGADGAPPAGSNQLVYLAIPVKQPAHHGRPDAHFRAHLRPERRARPVRRLRPRHHHRMERSIAGGGARTTLMEEDWEFVAASGERWRCA